MDSPDCLFIMIKASLKINALIHLNEFTDREISAQRFKENSEEMFEGRFSNLPTISGLPSTLKKNDINGLRKFGFAIFKNFEHVGF